MYPGFGSWIFTGFRVMIQGFFYFSGLYIYGFPLLRVIHLWFFPHLRVMQGRYPFFFELHRDHDGGNAYFTVQDFLLNLHLNATSAKGFPQPFFCNDNARTAVTTKEGCDEVGPGLADPIQNPHFSEPFFDYFEHYDPMTRRPRRRPKVAASPPRCRDASKKRRRARFASSHQTDFR